PRTTKPDFRGVLRAAVSLNVLTELVFKHFLLSCGVGEELLRGERFTESCLGPARDVEVHHLIFAVRLIAGFRLAADGLVVAAAFNGCDGPFRAFYVVCLWGAPE